jgi:hypothetical protein
MSHVLSRRLVPALALAAAFAAAGPSTAALAASSPVGAPGCDRLDDAACLLPFPNDAFRKDGAVVLKTAWMPRNAKGTAIDAAGWKGLDGFSPGSVILTKVPALQTDAALKKTGAVGLDALSKYTAKNAPVLVWDATAKKRWPVWAEVDNNAKAGNRLLEVHPATNFLEGHRYVVVLRSLKRADGSAITASRRFAKLRDGKATINARYQRIFKDLKKVGVKRDKSLFLTWDFTVAGEKSLTARVLHMRDTTFKGFGDANLADGVVSGAAPSFSLQPKPLTDDLAKFNDGRYAQVLEGTFTVPCYLTNGCAPGSIMTIDPKTNLPKLQGTYTARFTCVVPATATADHPARLALYGHGLLGKETEILSGPDVPKMAAESNTVFCATPWIGMANEDIPTAAGVLGDFSKMPQIPDRLQQGFLNALVLGRILAHPNGLATAPLLQSNGRPIVQPSLAYDSNSQGGINGGALTALAPDFTRAVLGVPGMNYSVLLPRSKDFEVYSQIMYPAYKSELERPLILDLAQLLWDRGEGNGYAQHMTTDPLPNTPKHTVLLDVALGDHQVTQFQADVEARTIGASIHTPIQPAGRAAQTEPAWGIPPIKSYPFSGSAIVYWDWGPTHVTVPTLANRPNSGLEDPHEAVRRTPAARAQKAAFLAPGGALIDTCNGAACIAAPDVG